MGNIWMQSVVVMCNTAVNTAEEPGGQFPFLAALILIVIILVVSVGDMVSVNKDKEGTIASKNDDENPNTKI